MSFGAIDFWSNIQVFFLVLVRVTGMFVVAPIFGRRSIPTYYKAGFSFFIALIMMNVIEQSDIKTGESMFTYAPLVFKEFIVGLILGFVGYIILSGIYIAGQMIDMKIGFGVVNIIDPMTNIQVPVTANFYTTITLLVLLMMGGHHLLIRALYESFSLLPLGEAIFSTALEPDVIRLFGSIFTIGFKIAAPIIAAVLVSDIGLGIITKTVPQLNVFVVGMPLKIVMGFIIMFITVPAFIGIVEMLIRGMDSEMYAFLKSMGGRP